MEGQPTTKLRVGEWCVDPDSGTMTRSGVETRLDVRSMRLLLCLVERRGQVVNIDELIQSVWAGVSVSPDSVYQAVTGLRRQLGDDPRKPVYIETVPRLGYRLIAPTGPWTDPDADDASQPQGVRPNTKADAVPGRSGARGILWAGVVLAVMAGAIFVLHERLFAGKQPATPTTAPALAVGVLPFIDLTEGMRDEEFADGMTEEVIDKLSKVSGVQVPSATASFYYKGKALSVSEIARGLKVNYLLDGSVRKSSGRVRIAARLVRTDSSYVIWTNTYDRPLSDLITVQDQIASEVVNALQSAVRQGQAPSKSD